MPKHSASGDADWVPPIVAAPRDRPGVHTIARPATTRTSPDGLRGIMQNLRRAEATASEPAGRDVNDMGAGIRFNFPGFAAFRPILWDEWFENFDRNDLLFVFERKTPLKSPSAHTHIGRREAERAVLIGTIGSRRNVKYKGAQPGERRMCGIGS